YPFIGNSPFSLRLITLELTVHAAINPLYYHSEGTTMTPSSTDIKRYKNFIAGKWVESGSDGSFQNINPADSNDIVGEFPAGGASELDEAVAAAQEAYSEWRLVPAPRRAQIIHRAGDILAERKEDLAQLMTREMGKVLSETRGDV